MSRELYRGRSKKVQKLGRDGLVEQDRATGQERRVSQRAADVSFGPERREPQRRETERREPERTGPVSQHREHQRRQYQQEVRQTENPAAVNGWESAPDVYALDRSAGSEYSVDSSSAVTSDTSVGGFDAPVPDAYAPEPMDAALSMRGAADMPMMDTAHVPEQGSLLVRLRSRRRIENGGEASRQEPGQENSQKAGVTQSAENRNRLQFDGERRISPDKSRNQREGDSVSPSLRGAADKPLSGRSEPDRGADGGAVRPGKYRTDQSGRLRFGAEQKPTDRAENRAAYKTQQVRRYSRDAAKPEGNRLNFEAAKPLATGGGSANPAKSSPVQETSRLLSTEAEPFSDAQDEDTQTETDAVEAEMETALILRNADRRPAKSKDRNAGRLRFKRDTEEQGQSGDKSEDRTEDRANRRRNTARAATDTPDRTPDDEPELVTATELAAEERPGFDPDTDAVFTADNADNGTVDPDGLSCESGGHLRFDRSNKS
ncbi:MAG: hypothetical protein J6X53_09350 [Abditibacteriota bacterium]|nr:hypothetical protein [Abditibacteriota bacterium]